MRLLVRSWNLFHGNTVPTGRHDRLEQMIRLASEDAPDLLCLQEVPVWALQRLEDWSGMTAFGDVAAPPRIGPFPSTAGIGRALTALHHGLFRSAFSGQANAILAAPGMRPAGRDALVLNSRAFRRKQAQRLSLPAPARLAWAKERRVCQAVRVIPSGGPPILVANLHATSYPADERLADAELLRAAVFADALARPDEVCVLAGDFNLKAARSQTVRDLLGPEWGFEGGGPWIDHVFARGAPAGPVERWPDERRRRDGRLWSDHAPVEMWIG